MNQRAPWRERIPSAITTAVWGLGVVFLLAAVSPPLQACDGGTAVPDPGNNPGLVEDCKILIALRDELAGSGSLNWDTQLAMTSWQYIRISGSPSRVTEVSGYQLTGVIPTELGQLSQLRQLYLGGNQLTGPIPTELGQLSQLRRLSLGGNQLTGPIPTELGQLSQLELLHLGSNQLTSEIPAELGRRSQLKWLHLDDNQLTGPIPTELGQLSDLRQLHLDDNQLTGTIPVELVRLSRLEWLYLDDNQLTGPIPIEMGQFSELEQLYLGNNQLTGSIPKELGQLARMRELNLYNNQLTGPIPAELGRLSRMWILVLGGNQLTGPIPTGLGQFSDLQYLVLSNNQLTGPIPKELGQLSELLWLHLQNNQLTGPIPPELGQLSQLRELHLQHNQLTGSIPTELGRLSQLREFSFQGNRLTGPVPIPLNHLPDVYVLNLAASWIGPGQMKVTWDDPGDPTASYEYRLWDPVQDWTDWGEIADPEMTLRAREERTIEWTLTVLPAHSDDRFRTVYTHIGIRASNRKGYSPEARARVGPLEVTTLYFPDYVDGGGWSVQLAISHIAPTEDAAVLVTAYDREGQPIPGFFDSEGTFGIPSLGTQILRSAGLGEIRRGWIEVQTDTASVSGLLTYRNARTGLEVSVEPVELGNHFALFVEESSGIGTGLAIFKPDPFSRIEFRIRDEDGINPLGEGFARVGNFNQVARTIPEWFDADGINTEFLRDFRGILLLRSEDGSLFAPIGIRFGKRGESLSSVPVIRVTAVPE